MSFSTLTAEIRTKDSREEKEDRNVSWFDSRKLNIKPCICYLDVDDIFIYLPIYLSDLLQVHHPLIMEKGLGDMNQEEEGPMQEEDVDEGVCHIKPHMVPTPRQTSHNHPLKTGGRYRPEDHMTASGPFAFGPAIRNAIATPTSLPSAPKTEITNQQQEKPTATSEDEGRFDPDDQWSPVIMGGPKKVKKERLKRERAKEKERERIKIKVERERDGQGVVPMDVDHEAETIDVDALTLPTEEKKVHVGPPDEFIKPEVNLHFHSFFLPSFTHQSCSPSKTKCSSSNSPRSSPQSPPLQWTSKPRNQPHQPQNPAKKTRKRKSNPNPIHRNNRAQTAAWGNFSCTRVGR